MTEFPRHPQTVREIERVARISQDRFVKDYLRRNQPVILTDLIDHWPARKSWSFESFSQLGADVEVYLEVGNVMQGEANFVPVKFGDYIRSILDSRNRDANREGESSERAVPYLSIFDIFHFFPQLKSDVDFSLLRSQKVLNYSAAFLGPRGTVTGLHFDWADNTLAQIRGHKAITLVSPDQSPLLYRSEKFDLLAVSSSVDIDHYDRGRFPLFERAKLQQATLHEGEMLFIPRGWWHHIRSLSPSITVSNFGFDARQLVVDGARLFSRYLMHQAGRWPVCTCHMMRDGKRVGRPLA